MPFPDSSTRPGAATVFTFATPTRTPTIGMINAQIQLDKQSFRGSRDRMNGKIVLTFNPPKQPRSTSSTTTNGLSKSADQEIFGPLKLKVILQGNATLKVLENRTSHAYILFYEIRKLFRRSTVVFDGPLRARADEPKVYPFQISFPERTDKEHGIFSALPPTFYTRFQASAARQAGKHQGAAWLDYTLQVQADMPGIDIEISRPPDMPLRFEQASSPFNLDVPSRTLEQRHIVQSYGLLPGDERPNGLFDRTRAVLRSVQKPVYVFDATCASIPASLHLDETLKFQVRVRPDAEATTATTAPEISLASGEVEILARTQLYATNEKGIDSPKLDHMAVIATLPLERRAFEEPFSKASDYTKSLSAAGPLPREVPPSFRILKLERSYRVRIVLRFVVAGEVAVLKKDLPLTVLPALVDGGAGFGAFAEVGSSSFRSSARRLSLGPPPEIEQLPAYEEAIKSAAVL